MSLSEFYDLTFRQFRNCVKGYNERIKTRYKELGQLAVFIQSAFHAKKPLKVADLVNFDDRQEITVERAHEIRAKIAENKRFFDAHPHPLLVKE